MHVRPRKPATIIEGVPGKCSDIDFKWVNTPFAGGVFLVVIWLLKKIDFKFSFLVLGVFFRKCIFPEGLAKELPKL